MTKDFDKFSGPLGKPTAAERRLVDACAGGTLASCLDLDEAERQVSASLIAFLCIGRFKHSEWPDLDLREFGLQLSNARIEGALNLVNRHTSGPMEFSNCTFSAGLNLEGAHIAGDLFLFGCDVSGETNLVRATIAGRFVALHSKFENPGGDAIQAHMITAAAWFMNGSSIKGRFEIAGADIAGQFGASEATFDNGDGDAIVAYYIKVQSCLMDRATVRGRFNIAGSEIIGQFGAEGATFTNNRGDAIWAQYTTFRGGILLVNADITGGIDLAITDVSKGIRIYDTKITADRYRAVSFRDAKISGEVNLRGSTLLGHVHANRAKIEGQMSFRGAKIIAGAIARSRGELPDNLRAQADRYSPTEFERQARHRHHAISLQGAIVDGRLVMPDERLEGIIDLSRARCDTIEDASGGWPEPLARHEKACAKRSCITEENADPLDVQHLVLDGFEYSHFEFPAGTTSDAGDIAQARIAWLAAQPARHLIEHFNPQPWRQTASVLRAMGYDEAAQKVSIERRVRQRLSDGTPFFQRLVSWSLHKIADYGFNPWKTVIIAMGFMALCAVVYWAGVQSRGGAETLADPQLASSEQPAFVQVRFGDIASTNGQAGKYPAFNALIYSLDTLLPFPELGMESFWRPNTNAWFKFGAASGPSSISALSETQIPIGWILYVLSMVESVAGALLVAIAITGFTGLLTRDEK